MKDALDGDQVGVYRWQHQGSCVLWDVANGLHTLHSHGIVHG